MKKSFIIRALALFFISSSIFAQGSDPVDFYDEVRTGQRDAGHYYGPIDPRFSFDQRRGDINYLDSIYENQFFHDNIHEDFFNLFQFWNKDISLSSACPNSDLGQNIRYIRYLFRLLSMSYLYEGMKDYQKILYELGEDEKSCEIGWQDVFEKCSAQSGEMKKFVRRVKGKIGERPNFTSFKKMSKEELVNAVDDFQSGKMSGVSVARVKYWCKENKKDCSKISLKDLKKSLVDSCNEDKKLINQICSEEDLLYGLTNVELSVSLLMQSNVANIINASGTGYSCLIRYQDIFKKDENPKEVIKEIFPPIHSALIERKDVYLQGEIFLPGALREFDDKGLSDFIYKEEPKIEIPAPKPVEPKKVEPPPVVAVAPVIIPPPVVKEEPKEEPKVIEKPLTQFENALKKVIQENFPRYALDMKKMKEEPFLDEKTLKALETPLKEYQTREALTDMRNYDKLGSKVEPMRLMFLRYLLDNELHQGLYNIVSVLGSTFYVMNDIESKTEPIYVELRNDESTSFQWQLTVLKSQ